MRRCYTLIELLIVVAILGMASVLLVPHLVGQDILSAEAAVRQLIGDLSFAQSDALAHQELRRVHFYADGRGYCLTRITQAQLGQPFDPSTADYVFDPLSRSSQQGNYIVDYTLDNRFQGVSLTTVDLDGGGRELHYDSLGGTIIPGGAPGLGGQIVLAMDDESYEITVAPFTGKLTVRKL